MVDENKKYTLNSIPDKDQELFRERLKSIREIQGLPKRRVPYASETRIHKWEDIDISGMKVSDFYNIAIFMDWSLEDTFAYFASSDVIPTLTRKSEKRMALLLRNMPEVFQETACDIVEELVNLSEKIPKIVKVSKNIDNKSDETIKAVEIFKKLNAYEWPDTESFNGQEPDTIFDLARSAGDGKMVVNEDIEKDSKKLRKLFKETS